MQREVRVDVVLGAAPRECVAASDAVIWPDTVRQPIVDPNHCVGEAIVPRQQPVKAEGLSDPGSSAGIVGYSTFEFVHKNTEKI